MQQTRRGLQVPLPVDPLLGGPESGSYPLHVLVALPTLGRTCTLAQVGAQLAVGRHLRPLAQPAQGAVTGRQHAPDHHTHRQD